MFFKIYKFLDPSREADCLALLADAGVPAELLRTWGRARLLHAPPSPTTLTPGLPGGGARGRMAPVTVPLQPEALTRAQG